MKDTEEFINIDLDSSQNRLFRLDIVLTAAAFSMEIFHVLGGAPGATNPESAFELHRSCALHLQVLLLFLAHLAGCVGRRATRQLSTVPCGADPLLLRTSPWEGASHAPFCVDHSLCCRNAGILGENVPIPSAITKTVREFWAVNIITLLICFLVFFALYSW